MPSPPLLLLQDIRLTFGGTPLFEGAELSVGPEERLALVGRNGSGKSTLLKIAAGLVEPHGGTRFLQPGKTVCYLPQEPDLSGFATTLAYVESGLGPVDDPHRARYLLQRLGMTGDESPADLSGGEARRCALAHVLAPDPDILLLDEPTNHLDLPTIEWLEGELAARRAAMVLVSHDRRFLGGLARAMVWVDRGVTRRLDRPFAAFEEWRDQVLEQAEIERHKLDRKIAREEDWLRYGVTARRTRNQRRLSELHALRDQRRGLRRAPGGALMEQTRAELSGKLVIEADHIYKSFGERRLVRDFSTLVTKRDRIGIVGANGAGKTTLLKLLIGEMPPDQGTVKLGAKLEMAYLDQGRASLDPASSLADALTGGHGDAVTVAGRQRHVVGYLKDFLFAPEQARTPVAALSGGERGRLALAVTLSRPSNLLVLDEPTNDLDVETLDLLQEMIADYQGAVLIISHDRDFLDRTVSAVIAPEGDGAWIDYAGGFADMMAQRQGRPLPASTGGGARPAPARPPAAKPAPVARPADRLSFNDRHALATLPARIAALEAEIGRHQATLAGGDLHANDPARMRAAVEALAAASAALEAAEERWLALELRREALEGGRQA